MKTISLKLPERLLRKLQRAANDGGRSKSDVVRSALEQYLDGQRTAGEVSALELAGDLAGCLQGPGDLSYNKRHMKGYGR
jgi:metal-responsive CopG/Arc/MetJ family transcriptional regulator